MDAFEIIYLGRSRFHRHQDATAMYFRVLRGGRYVGAYAGAVAGPDLVSLGRQGKPFWAALAHATARAIGVRLVGNIRNGSDLHEADTIWLKAADLRSHMGKDLPLPREDEVFRTLELDEDPLAPGPGGTGTRILSAGSTSISLKAAAVAGSDGPRGAVETA